MNLTKRDRKPKFENEPPARIELATFSLQD